MRGHSPGIEVGHDSPVFQGEALENEKEEKKARQVLEDADALRLKDPLAIIIPDPENPI